MGLCCCKITKEFYPDVDNKNEREIREWEENNLGALRHTFTFLRKNSNFESNLLEQNKVHNFFKAYFTDEILNIVDLPYFRSGELYISERVEGLILLLSRAEFKHSGSVGFYDKAYYILTEVNTNEEDKLNQPLEESSENLKKIIIRLIEISNEVNKYYISTNAHGNKDYINEISIDSEKLEKYIIKFLFKKAQGSKIKTYNIDDFNSIIGVDRWFMTTGYFREAAMQKKSLKEAKNTEK